jgi:hypothetical protein
MVLRAGLLLRGIDEIEQAVKADGRPLRPPDTSGARLRRAPKGRPDRLLRQAKNEQIDSGSLRNLAMADRITGGRERLNPSSTDPAAVQKR